jgi:hypothetical protein
MRMRGDERKDYKMQALLTIVFTVLLCALRSSQLLAQGGRDHPAPEVSLPEIWEYSAPLIEPERRERIARSCFTRESGMSS